MTWDTLLAMLGTGGLVAFIDWLIRLKVTRRKSVLDRDDISRLMAEHEDEFRKKQYADKIEILIRVSELEEMLFQLVRCKYYDTCPARHKLQEYKANLQYQRNRQPPMEQKGVRNPRDNPVEPRNVDNPDGQPP